MITREQADTVREIVSGFGVEQKKQFLEKYASLDEKKKEIVIGRLLATADATNKKNDIDLTYDSPKPKKEAPGADYLASVKERMSEVDANVKSRGDYLESMASNINAGGVRKGLGFMQGAGIPAAALESSISNPMLAMQRGNFNPADLAKETYLGATLQKQGQYGDVYRGAIPNKAAGDAVGTAVGLGLSLAGPINTFRAMRSSFGDVSKFSDKLIKGAGVNIVKSSDEAEKFVGASISNAYKKLDSELIDGSSWTRALERVPEAVKKEVSRTVGDVETLLPTIGNMRKIKTLLGKYRPGNYGKDARGLAENIEVAKLDEAYSGIKSVITSTISKKIGTKNAEKLLDLDETATAVYRATSELKNAVVNPRLLSPTRGGKAAKGLEESGDVSTREAMNIIRHGGGKQAKKLMNKAIRALEIFNNRERGWKAAGHIVSALTYGGAIGSVGGMLVARGVKKGSSE